MAAQETMLLWLDQAACQNPVLVGGKTAALSRLAATYPVPPGFCLTTTAHAESTVAQADVALSPALQIELATAYATLADRCKIADPSVAVRSSAVGEDGAEASFAGQYATYLNLQGIDAVADAVVRCWAATGSARVQAYHRQQALSTDVIQLAVLVQQLIAADSAAVVFSANPVTGNPEEIVINTAWGLGESLVSGSVTPDVYYIRKSDLSITRRTIAEKEQMTVRTPSGTREVAVPRLMRSQPTIADTQALALAQLALNLETSMGRPVDVECAYQNETLYLLQCRPITTPVTGSKSTC